jgi:hypothetical protein
VPAPSLILGQPQLFRLISLARAEHGESLRQSAAAREQVVKKYCKQEEQVALKFAKFLSLLFHCRRANSKSDGAATNLIIKPVPLTSKSA